MPNGNQFTLHDLLSNLGYGNRAIDILRSHGVKDPSRYTTGLQRLLGTAETQVGELGGEYSTMLGNIEAGYTTARRGLTAGYEQERGGLQAERQLGMSGLRESWMEQAAETQGDWQFGGRRRQLRRARRAAGAEQERLQTGYETGQERLLTGYESEQERLGVARESDISGAERWRGGEYRDLLASLESGISDYIRDIVNRGAEFRDVSGATAATLPGGGFTTTPSYGAGISTGRPGQPLSFPEWQYENFGGTYSEYGEYVQQMMRGF